MAKCSVCFRHCEIGEKMTGYCGARICKDGIVVAGNYGIISGMALDPIEKKPLRHFHPGARILSVGSYGCNMRCPFCQNHEISWSDSAMSFKNRKAISPQTLVTAAKDMIKYGNIGLAYTYNEPLIGYEFVLDTAKLSHSSGMLNVLVTNGTAEISVLEKLAPFIDAMNIDLKGFTDKYYRETLGGNLDAVKSFITRAVQLCHVELTTLVVPGENDSDEEMLDISSWIAELTDAGGNQIGNSIPLHISRFFPRFHMMDRPPTDIKRIYHLADVARTKLTYVYTGNC